MIWARCCGHTASPSPTEKIYFTIEASRAVARYDHVAGRIDWIMGTGQGGTHMTEWHGQSERQGVN